MFERTYIISLPYKLERRARLERHLAETGLDVGPVRWFTAMSGDWMGHPSWFRAGNGAWGCLMSHLHIMREALADGLHSVCVLEDDVVFHERAPEMLQQFMAEVPEDWDQLYLGGQHLREPWSVPGCPGVLRGQNVNRTHAFAHKGSALPQIMTHILEAGDYRRMNCGWHIDHQLGLAHEKQAWNVYCPPWWLAAQEAGASNISGRENVRLWWQPYIYARGLPFIQVPRATSEVILCEVDGHVHFGWNLRPGTREDVGLEKCVASDTELRAWLEMIAREALDQHKLPGWQHEGISAERVAALWAAGAREVEGGVAELPRLREYPFNGLFAHPWASAGLR
jgi:Glycosyltransferase family 25 (LPS biosynthesis protein)